MIKRLSDWLMEYPCSRRTAPDGNCIVHFGYYLHGLDDASEAAAGDVAGLGWNPSHKRLVHTIVESVRLSAMLLFIVVGAQVFSYSVYAWGFSAVIGEQVAALTWPPEAILRY